MRFHLALSSALFANEVAAWRHKPKEQSNIQDGGTRTRSLLQRLKRPLLNRRNSDPSNFEVLRNQEGDHHLPLRTKCDPDAPVDVGILQCGEGYDCVPMQRSHQAVLTNEQMIGGGSVGICLPSASDTNRSVKQGKRWMAEEYEYACQYIAHQYQLYGPDYENCDFTRFNFEDASGKIACRDYVDKMECGVWRVGPLADSRSTIPYFDTACVNYYYGIDCDQRPYKLFYCYKLLCTTMEQACAHEYSFQLHSDEELYFTVDGIACTSHDCQFEIYCDSEGNCREHTLTRPVCPGFIRGSNSSNCETNWRTYFPFHKSSCDNPFSIPGVTGLATCNQDTANDMLISGQLDGYCGSIYVGHHVQGNSNINSHDHGHPDTQGGGNGSSSSNPKDKDNEPIIEGNSSANILVLFSLLLTGIVTELLLVGT